MARSSVASSKVGQGAKSDKEQSRARSKVRQEARLGKKKGQARSKVRQGATSEKIAKSGKDSKVRQGARNIFA